MPEMQLACNDISHAYKRCPVQEQAHGIIFLWDNVKRVVVFANQWGLPFGDVTSVTSFSRVLHLLMNILSPLFAVTVDHYVNDTIHPDFKDDGDTAQDSLGRLFVAADFEISAKKRKCGTVEQEELGVVCDMTHTATK